MHAPSSEEERKLFRGPRLEHDETTNVSALDHQAMPLHGGEKRGSRARAPNHHH
jgi:hypothetical protein